MNKKGFVSFYALILCGAFLGFHSMIIQKIKTNMVYQENTLSLAELFAINKAKIDLLAYEESDETIAFHGYDISFAYDDITCYITIEKEGERLLSSILEFDDIEECVVGYRYESD